MAVSMTNVISMTELVKICFMAAPPDVFHHEMTDGMNYRETEFQIRACQRNRDTNRKSIVVAWQTLSVSDTACRSLGSACRYSFDPMWDWKASRMGSPSVRDNAPGALSSGSRGWRLSGSPAVP
jgi:hypothetical protein